MTDRLDHAVEALQRVLVAVRWSDVERRLDEPVEPSDPVEISRTLPRHRPGRALVAVTSVAAAVLLAVVVVVMTQPDGNDAPVLTETGPSPTAPPPVVDTTTTTQPAISTNRHGAVVAWAGDRFLVWGGEAGTDTSGRADGWAFDPGTEQVTAIPPAPIAPRDSAVGVWSGTELLVCCGGRAAEGDAYRTDTAAAYDPEERSWRKLADPPIGAVEQYGAAVWTGAEMIVVLSGHSGPTTVAAYEPVADRWRVIEGAPPALGYATEVVWTGDELIVWDRRTKGQVGDSTGIRSEADAGHRYDPVSGSWTELPPMPDGSAVTQASMAWTGSDLVVFGLAADGLDRAVGARWQPSTGGWQPLSDPDLPPIDYYNGTPGSQRLVWDDTTERVIVWPAHGDEWPGGVDGGPGPVPVLAYDPATDRWDRLDEASLGFYPTLVAGGGLLLTPDEADPTVLRTTG